MTERHTITSNGVETMLTAGQAAKLLGEEAVYECLDLDCQREDEHVYHVSPELDLETAYEARTGPFAVDALLVCRSCGGEDLRAWYSEPTQQGVVGLWTKSEDGELRVQFEYDGVSYGHTDCGDDEEYRCAECDDSAETLEELVGLPRPTSVTPVTVPAAITRVEELIEDGEVSRKRIELYVVWNHELDPANVPPDGPSPWEWSASEVERVYELSGEVEDACLHYRSEDYEARDGNEGYMEGLTAALKVLKGEQYTTNEEALA